MQEVKDYLQEHETNKYLQVASGKHEGGLYHAPVIPAGIQWNYFWQRALPKLPFRGPFIPVE